MWGPHDYCTVCVISLSYVDNRLFSGLACAERASLFGRFVDENTQQSSKVNARAHVVLRG